MKKITKKKLKRKLHLIREDITDMFHDGEIQEYLFIISMISGYVFFMAFILLYLSGVSLYSSLINAAGAAFGVFIGLFASIFLVSVIDNIFFQD